MESVASENGLESRGGGGIRQVNANSALALSVRLEIIIARVGEENDRSRGSVWRLLPDSSVGPTLSFSIPGQVSISLGD